MLLHCHTYFSLKYGTYKPRELLEAAHRAGHKTVAITDINNTSAIVDSVRISAELGVKVIAGVDFRNGIKPVYMALAMNNRGFLEINEHLTSHLHSGDSFHPEAPSWQHVAVIYPFTVVEKWMLLQAPEFQRWKSSPSAYVAIQPSELNRYRLSRLTQHSEKALAVPCVSFAGKRQHNIHRLLRAMDLNTLLSKLQPADQAPAHHTLCTVEAMAEAFAEVPTLIQNTQQLAAQCQIQFDYKLNKNKQVFSQSREADRALLLEACRSGMVYRFGGANEVAEARMHHELAVIDQMGFASYFLINWDLVNYARSRGYFHVGRGSGANSLVAYLLRITDVDPIELDLYFERFINPHRTSPPDFDVDFSWADRTDITDYLFTKYGWQHVALQGTYSTFKDKAISRELGKVFGVPDEEIDKFQKSGRNHDLGQYGDLILQYGEHIKDFPSHLSIHSSGILISEEPIAAYSATFLPPKGFPTTQFSMIEAEDLGLYKFDILSQRGLGKIRDSVAIVAQNRGEEIDVHDIARFKNDERIRTLLREGRAIGCFYVESPAMRMLLTKLKADSYIALVAASSIIRPGVSRSGMMREYIQRFQQPERREAARAQCPELYAILEETFGVMVYQEDVIRVAHFFAGLTLAESDILRRGMSWKFKERSEFHRVRETFFANCRQKGYGEELVNRVWFEIETFANFAFAKGHSASYAVESYQALFLKAYYPIEYMVATVNNGGGFYQPELYLHEARMHGATIEAPCVNTSEAITTLCGTRVWLGFHFIKDLENRTIELLLKARSHGAFTSLADFIDRVPIGTEQLQLLVKVGAFRCFGRPKKELYWEMRLLHQKRGPEHDTNALFATSPPAFSFPPLHSHPLEEAFDQLELLGFPLCSPFELSSAPLEGGVCAADLPKYLNGVVMAYGYLVTARKTHTAKGETMYFGNFVDQQGRFLDTVHFPPVATAFPFSGRGIYRVEGRVTEDFGCYQIEATALHRIPFVDDPRYSETEAYKGTKDHSLKASTTKSKRA